MRINGVEFLTVVALTMNEGDEQAAGFRAEQIFEYARLEILLQLVPGGVLAVFERPGFAWAGRRPVCLPS